MKCLIDFATGQAARICSGRFMARNPFVGIVPFLAIAFGIPWLAWLFARSERLSLWLFPLFCSVAGFAAAFVEGGKAGLFAFSRRVFAKAHALRYVLIGMAIPLLIGLSYVLSHGVALSDFVLSPAAIMGLTLGAALVTGPLAEEFGWRGYLQHTLLNRLAPIWAALIVGSIWWAWHFPLYQSSVFASLKLGFSFWAYLVTWSVFMVYLVQRAGGSVWPAVAVHWIANTHANILGALLPSTDGSVLPGGSKGEVFYLTIAAVFALANYRFFFRKSAQVDAGSGRIFNTSRAHKVDDVERAMTPDLLARNSTR